MKHPDDSDEAIEFMHKRAKFLIGGGMGIDQALEEAIDHWRVSLLRSQMCKRFEDDLRRRGKPTLHVSMFEAAKIR